MKSLALILFTALAEVSAHGVIVSPEPRCPGPALAKACGDLVYAYSAVDKYGPVEFYEAGIIISPPENADDCQLLICSGLKYEDSPPAQHYHGGEDIHIKIDAPIKHLKGHANVSVVDTTTNTIIGSMLKYWHDYLSASDAVTPKDQIDFTVTLPHSFGGACKKPGVCVIQWFWFSTACDAWQHFESCIDFVSDD
ncbi:hypothetical protein RUND412_000625 [Rhizina undulata]